MVLLIPQSDRVLIGESAVLLAILHSPSMLEHHGQAPCLGSREDRDDGSGD